MKKMLCLFAAALLAPLYGKFNGDYLNRITTSYVTPHYRFQTKPDSKQIRALFILSRSGARDAVETVQRMPMEAEYFLTYNQNVFAQEDMYESTIEGTSRYEKEKELTAKLDKEYDVCAVGFFEFTRLPESAQLRLLRAVTSGMGLILVHPAGVRQLPYRKLYAEPSAVPEELKKFAQPSGKRKLEAWKVGKGRLIALSWGGSTLPKDRSCLPSIPYSNQWKTQNENAAAFLGMLCRYGAGREIAARNPEIRIRDRWNRDVTSLKSLPGGVYYRDELGENGAFLVTEFQVPSAVGKVNIALPETVKKKEVIRGTLTMEKASGQAMEATLELLDSPYGRIWHRQTFSLPAGQKQLAFTWKDYYMPTLAGYVRASLKKQDGDLVTIADQLVFFPDPSLDDYMQLGWDSLKGSAGELLAPVLVDRLGWNLGLTHPSAEGANARDMAMLNQKIVPYVVRVMIRKSPKGGVVQPNWFFLPAKLRPRQKALNQDECFYRPEVRKLWAESIAVRVKNLAKYSAAIYNLGDENELELEAGYGESDLYWFRNFLKEKYRTVDALNYNYRTSYKSFDEVPHMPLKEAKESGNYPAWGDHRAYMEKMYADFHAFLREEIRKHDPDAVVGAEGSVPGNLEQTIRSLEYWGPYSNLVGDELLRSFGGDKIRMLWWGGYPASHGGRGKYAVPLLRDLLLGTVNGNAWFAANPGSNHSAFGCDLTIAAYVKNYLADLDRLKNGTAQLLIRNPLENTGVAFYWSHPSSAAALLDPRCGNPSDGIIPLIRTAYRTGLGFEFLSANTLERLKQAKVVFLCGASALSDRECEALLQFVRGGGTLIADVNPAMMNENLRVREKNPLSALFGNITFPNAGKGESGSLNLPGFRASRVPMTSARIFTEKKFGSGKAILCNFSLSSAANTADPATPFDKWVLSLLGEAKAAGNFLVGNVDENTIVRVRRGKDFSLLGVMVQPGQMAETVDIDLKNSYHVYEVDRGSCGPQNKLRIAFDKSPMKLYALFREKQTAPEFSIASLKRGESLKITLPELSSGRVFRLELSDPSGTKIWTAVFDREEKRPVRAVAYNEKSGRWSARLTDVATGLSNTIDFEVKE